MSPLRGMAEATGAFKQGWDGPPAWSSPMTFHNSKIPALSKVPQDI